MVYRMSLDAPHYMVIVGGFVFRSDGSHFMRWCMHCSQSRASLWKMEYLWQIIYLTGDLSTIARFILGVRIYCSIFQRRQTIIQHKQHVKNLFLLHIVQATLPQFIFLSLEERTFVACRKGNFSTGGTSIDGRSLPSWNFPSNERRREYCSIDFNGGVWRGVLTDYSCVSIQMVRMGKWSSHLRHGPNFNILKFHDFIKVPHKLQTIQGVALMFKYYFAIIIVYYETYVLYTMQLVYSPDSTNQLIRLFNQDLD